MRSNVSDVLPPAVKRSLKEFGSDLATARRKRGITVLAVAERMAVAKNTYMRAEKGDPKVGVGVYAMALFVLGFGSPLGTLIDVSRDDTGLLLDEERLPKRVRMKKSTGAAVMTRTIDVLQGDGLQVGRRTKRISYG